MTWGRDSGQGLRAEVHGRASRYGLRAGTRAFTQGRDSEQTAEARVRGTGQELS